MPPATPGKNVFVVSEERAGVIHRQNYVITSARHAWTKMKETYSKSALPRKRFLGF